MELGGVIESFIGTSTAIIVLIGPLTYFAKKKLENFSLFGGMEE